MPNRSHGGKPQQKWTRPKSARKSKSEGERAIVRTSFGGTKVFEKRTKGPEKKKKGQIQKGGRVFSKALSKIKGLILMKKLIQEGSQRYILLY